MLDNAEMSLAKTDRRIAERYLALGDRTELAHMVLAEYELQPHHVRLLSLAAEAWDRAQQARTALAEHGTTYLDRFGTPRARPEVAIERDSRLAFARILREVDLDGEVGPDPRLPRRGGG